MKQNLLAIALTLAIGGALGLYVWHDYQSMQAWLAEQRLEPDPAPSPSAAVAPSIGGMPKPEPQRRHANGLYRCEQAGTVTYQDEPCPTGVKQAEVKNGSLSVAARTTPVQLAQLETPSSATVGVIARADEPWFGESNAGECNWLRHKIERIDEAARHHSTEYLKEERRKAVRRKYDLGCSEFN